MYLAERNRTHEELERRVLERTAELGIANRELEREVSERKRAEARLNHLATHDALTDLPNRNLFADRLGQALLRTAWRKRSVAVLFLDLDRFKVINDTLGHAIGDLMLKVVAERLTQCIRTGDTVARLGGDEFVLILDDLAQPQDTTKVAQKILDAFSKPVEIDRRELFITASIGIALYPGDGEEVEALLKNADTAMYRAKEQGKNNYQLYSASLNVKASERLTMEGHLRHGLERGEFLLHYQPQVDLVTGRIVAMEALIRWKRPGWKIISPADFIPLLEETGLILPIGEWVLRTACAQNKAWQRAGHPPIRVSVNLSGRQFQKTNLIRTIAAALDETGLSPKFLELELTESIIMKNEEATIISLRQLHESGVAISIDDFGIGYSSLSYLNRFPINTLKVDRSFVNDISTHPDNAAIVTAIITMAHSLHLNVVAEGVETADQLEFLRALKCDQMQGYLASRPLSAEEAEELLAERKPLI
jgi:diguanylate cyclase (GGDEF)-like protein